MTNVIIIVHGASIRNLFKNNKKPFIKESDHLGHVLKYQEHALKSQRKGPMKWFGNKSYHQDKAIAHNNAAIKHELLSFPHNWYMTATRMIAENNVENARFKPKWF